MPARTPSGPRRHRGSITVELALIAIPLLFVTLAIVEYARAMYTYNVLVKSTRDAARFLSGFDPTVPSEYPTAAATARAVYGGAGTGTTPVAPGLTTAMVRICDRTTASPACAGGSFANVPTGGTGTMNLVRVEIVGYTFVPFIPFVSSMATVTFDTIGTTMRQVL